MFSYSPFSFMMYTMLIMSTIFTIYSPSWYTAWMMLEINMLSFLPIMSMSKNNQETEASTKYFLIQSMGSLLMLMGSTSMLMSSSTKLSMLILTTAIMIKLGAAPCHLWYPSVMSSMSWTNCFILSTWQKLAPLSLLCLMNSKMNYIILSMIAAMNAILGGMMGMNQTHLRTLLAYSSIGHIGWMICMLSIHKPCMTMFYFIMYSIIVFPIFMLMNMTNSKSVSNLYSNFKFNSFLPLAMSILLLSLGGLPPLTGFLPKLMVIYHMLNHNAFLLIMLLLGSYMNLYYYMNISFSLMMSTNKSMKSSNKFINISIMMATLLLALWPLA